MKTIQINDIYEFLLKNAQETDESVTSIVRWNPEKWVLGAIFSNILETIGKSGFSHLVVESR